MTAVIARGCVTSIPQQAFTRLFASTGKKGNDHCVMISKTRARFDRLCVRATFRFETDAVLWYSNAVMARQNPRDDIAATAILRLIASRKNPHRPRCLPRRYLQICGEALWKSPLSSA